MASPAPSNPWIWDVNRQEYRYWVPEERCWLYQSGVRVSAAPDQGVTATAQSPESPRTIPAYPDISGNTYNHATSPGSSNDYALATSMATLSVTSPETGSLVYNSDYVQRQVVGPPVERITDPILYQNNAYAVKKFYGTPEETERLDPRYKIRRPGRKFFKLGKVFKTLWPEIAGDTEDNITIVTQKFSGERLHTKIRWFVVIREGENFCSCLPIQTYGGQGVAKKSVVKNHHAIIYTGKIPPEPARNEKPAPRKQAGTQTEAGMRGPPIRVRQNAPTDKLDKMSRVNYVKIYSVEHNLKVYDFGRVHKDDEVHLISNFHDAWGFKSLLPPPHESPEPAESATTADPQGSYFQSQSEYGTTPPVTNQARAVYTQGQNPSVQPAYTQGQFQQPQEQSPQGQAAYYTNALATNPSAGPTYHHSQYPSPQTPHPASQVTYTQAPVMNTQSQVVYPQTQQTYPPAESSYAQGYLAATGVGTSDPQATQVYTQAEAAPEIAPEDDSDSDSDDSDSGQTEVPEEPVRSGRREEGRSRHSDEKGGKSRRTDTERQGKDRGKGEESKSGSKGKGKRRFF